MKQTFLVFTIILQAVLCSPTAFGQTQTKNNIIVVPFLVEHNEILVPVKINDKDAYLELDTGATTTAVDLRVYGNGKLVKSHAVLSNGARIACGIGSIGHLKFGDANLIGSNILPLKSHRCV